MVSTLTESGYAIGTAYQLADDILDATGTEQVSGKTMGSDEARGKTTAATLDPALKTQAVEFVDQLCLQAEQALASWPAVLGGWQSFMEEDMRPALKKNLAFAAP